MIIMSLFDAPGRAVYRARIDKVKGSIGYGR